jgi:hypothetical protein
VTVRVIHREAIQILSRHWIASPSPVIGRRDAPT